MFEAKTLQDSLLPLIYMSIPFGIAPRLPNTRKYLQFLTLAFYFVGMVYVVITIVLLILVDSNIITNDNSRKFIRDVPSKINCGTAVIATIAGLTTHSLDRRKNTFANIIESLARIDEDLKLDMTRSYTKTKRVISGILIGMPVSYLAVLLWTSYREDWSIVFIIVPGISWKLMVIQYVALAVLLKQRFALINRHLMVAFGIADFSDQDLTVLKMSNDIVINRIICTKRDMKNSGQILEILDMLQDKHSTLIQLIEDANSLYAISNITIILEVVVVCTRNVYCIIDIILGGYKSWAKDSFILMVPAVCIALTKILVFAFVCDEAAAVARRPVVLVENLKLHLGGERQKIVERLDLFARHIQNKRPIFTAYSLVNFDRTLIGDIVSTIVMYIIILLQFAVSNVSMRSFTETTSQMFKNSSSP